MIKLRTVLGIVPDEALSPVQSRADVDCPRCHGKGISGFRARAGLAVVCKCVEQVLRMEAEEKLSKPQPEASP